MSLEVIYKAVRVLHWLRSMQRKDDPPLYPHIQAYCRHTLDIYDASLQVTKKREEQTAPASKEFTGSFAD